MKTPKRNPLRVKTMPNANDVSLAIAALFLRQSGLTVIWPEVKPILPPEGFQMITTTHGTNQECPNVKAGLWTRCLGHRVVNPVSADPRQPAGGLTE